MAPAVELLLEGIDDVDFIDGGATALWKPADSGVDAETSTLLLESGADMNKTFRNRTPYIKHLNVDILRESDYFWESCWRKLWRY